MWIFLLLFVSDFCRQECGLFLLAGESVYSWYVGQTVGKSKNVFKSYICPTNAHLNCFKMLKFTLKFTINAPTCFGLTKSSSGSLRCVLR